MNKAPSFLTELIISAVIVITVFSCMYGLVYSGYMVGHARGQEDIYLDCRDRGETVLHHVAYKCEKADD